MTTKLASQFIQVFRVEKKVELSQLVDVNFVLWYYLLQSLLSSRQISNEGRRTPQFKKIISEGQLTPNTTLTLKLCCRRVANSKGLRQLENTIYYRRHWMTSIWSNPERPSNHWLVVRPPWHPRGSVLHWPSYSVSPHHLEEQTSHSSIWEL